MVGGLAVAGIDADPRWVNLKLSIGYRDEG